MQQDKKGEEGEEVKKTYEYLDLIKFETPNNYSGFGKMKLSTKPSSPIYGFGSASRKQQEHVFTSKELAKTMFLGKNSAGPNYEVRGTDKYSYKILPKWKIGTEIRNTLNTGQKFDFYDRQDVHFEPESSDQARKPKAPTVKIGLESRFPNDPKRHKGTPGPQYNPSLRHEIPNSSKYTFGFKREIAGFSPLVACASTGQLVGPGSYLKNFPKVSTIEDNPLWSIGKGPKINLTSRQWDIHQTYDTKSIAIGPQTNSKKKTLPQFSFGRETRDKRNKTGQFKDMMATQPTKVRIQHPKF